MLTRLNSTICGLLAAVWASADPALAVARAALPPGLEIAVLDAGLDRPAAMDVSAEGHVAVGSYGDSIYIYERDGGAIIKHRIPGLREPTGVAWIRDSLVSIQGPDVIMFQDPVAELRDGRTPQPQPLAKIAGAEQQLFIKYDEEHDLLYIGVPSSCNSCLPEEGSLNGTIVAYEIATGRLYVHARGLRAPRGLDLHPATGELWATDASSYRFPPLATPADELNRIATKGLHFGYPYCHQGDMPEPHLEDSVQCGNYEPPAELLGVRSQPHGLHFIRGDALLEPGSALVALRGGWKEEGEPRAGFEVRQLLFSPDGRELRGNRPFIEGWLDAQERHYARPAGIAETKEGAILISDSANGAVYIVEASRGNEPGQHQDAGGD